MANMRIIIVFVSYYIFLSQIGCCEKSLPINSFNKLRGKALRVITGHFPPVTIIYRNSSGHVTGYDGLLYQQLIFIAQALGFTYEIYPSLVNTNGVRFSNGSWNGILGAVQRREADLAMAPVAVSLDRYEAVEFCGTIGGDDTSMMVKYPDLKISTASTLEVFSFQVWIGLIISALAVVGIGGLIIHVKKAMSISKGHMKGTEDVFLYVFGTITSQGSYFRSGHKSIGMLAFAWCLAAFVFVNTYNCTLTSYMSVTYRRPVVNTFDDLASMDHYNPLTLEGSIQHIDILSSPTASIKKVGEKLKECSGCRMRDFDLMVKKVLSEDYFVAILATTVAKGYMQKYSSDRETCRLTLAKDKLTWKPMYFAVPKSSSYIEEINLQSWWWIASGVYSYWYKTKEKFPKQCQLVYDSKGISTEKLSKPLKLKQLFVPFIILFCGYVLSFMIFVIEIGMRR